MDPKEQLLQLQTKMDELGGKITTEVKTLITNGMGEENPVIKSLRSELAAVKKSQEAAAEQLKQYQAKLISGYDDDKNPNKKKFDLGAFVLAQYKANNPQASGHNDPWADAGLEKELVDIRMKAATAGVGASGGYLIPIETTNEIIDLVIADMPVMDMGPTILRGLTGDLPVPTITGRPTGYHVGENASVTVSDGSFGQKVMRPREAAGFTKQSEKLIYQSRGVADTVIRRLLGEALALEIEENGLINGTNTQFRPMGLYNTPNMTTSTVAVTGNRFTLDNAAQMVTDMEVANELKYGNANSFGFLMHPRVKAGLRRQKVQTFSTQTAQLGLPVMVGQNILLTDELLAQQLGYKFRTTTLVPHNESAAGVRGTAGTYSSVLFGNFKYFWVGFWGDLVIKVSDQAGDGSTGSAFLQRQLYILATQMYDCLAMRPTAFSLAVGAETTEGNWTI